MGTAASSDRPTALVTGANRGLGLETCNQLRAKEFRIILTSRDEKKGIAATRKLDPEGRDVVFHQLDVTDRGSVSGLVNDLPGLASRLDLLVNNASELGESPLPPLVRAKRGDILRVYDVNVLAPVALVQEALPFLTRSRGLVVNITSDAAVGAYPGWGVYGASKAALDLVSKTLAAELREQGVGVVSVDPGDMRTKMHQDAFPGQDISDRPLPEVTVPFWAWLLSQDPLAVSGGRYQAQAAVWEVPA